MILAGAAVLLALQGVVLALWPAAHVLLIDLQVYVAGGQHLLEHHPLYAGGVLLDLPFVYPPVAAVLFVPLALVPLPVLKVAWTAGSVVLLALVVRRCAPGLRPAVVALLVVLAVGLDPVRTTLYLGQVNVVLLALVLLDLTGRSRWRGVGLGVAAAVKLTPLLFVAYLLLTRQFRAAGTALAAFAGATALGFAVAPGDSVQFWLRGTFAAANRISAVDGASNHSVTGLVGRLGGSPTAGTVAAVALGILTLVVAVRLREDPLLALTVVGLGSAACAPFAWSHHYVWCVPLLVLLVDRRRWAGVAVALVATAAVVTRLPGPAVGPIPATGAISLQPDVYLAGFALLLAAAGTGAPRRRGTLGSAPR